MPRWVLDADAFMTLYPGLTPRDVLEMDLDCFEWLPLIREARVKAARLAEAAGPQGAQFGRHGPGG